MLRLHDLPTGFQPAGHHYESISAAAASSRLITVSQAQYAAWGYVIGYEAGFDGSGSLGGLFSGGVEIRSRASVYRTSAGAEKSLALGVKVCSRRIAASSRSA